MARQFKDLKTGKIINIAYYRTEEQHKTHLEKQKKEKYRKTKAYQFVACYHDTIKEVTKHLTLIEAGAVMKLLLYLKINGKGLLTKEGKPFKQKDLQKILGKGATQTKQIINRLEYLSILIPIKEGRSKIFYINEDFHRMGKLGKKPFTKLLKSRLKEIVNELPLNHLGLLYKILPYFHLEKCFLCHNPTELDVSMIRKMNREELAKAINYDPDELTKIVKNLRKKGLIMTTESCGNLIYYVHPDLMYGRDDDRENEYTNSLRAMFEEHMKKV
uniref:Replication protein n=1 Tax=Geobacillus sp. (strain WCH70) TaxID=471223 RepID=C5D541_GEOSW